MARISFTKTLAQEYQRLYDSCQIRPEYYRAVDQQVERIDKNRKRYEKVSSDLGIPWFFVAAIHSLESNLDFTKHLHNGDPLTARTVHVPRGRPKEGSPPFTWEESAEDALKLKRLHLVKDWSLPKILYKLEEYNGWGYRIYHPHVLSPYLWSFTNHYTSGKYTADGVWSDTAKSKQCGAAAIIKRLSELGIITLGQDQTIPKITFSDSVKPHVQELQAFLNSLPGICLRQDGIPGTKTSKAFKEVFGYYLKGDPRGET